MTKRSANRAVAWGTAGLAASTAACLAIVFLTGLSGCSDQESAAQAQSGERTAPTAAPAGPDQPVPVKVVNLAPQHLQRVSTPHPAHVAPYEKTDLYAKATGYLETFGEIQGRDGKPRPLDIGDRVAKGQVLARLWIPEMQKRLLQKEAAVDQAQADADQAEAAITQAAADVTSARATRDAVGTERQEKQALLDYEQKQFDRIKKLAERGNAAIDLVDERLAKLEAARAALATVEARVRTADAQIAAARAAEAKARADHKSALARIDVMRADADYVRTMMEYAEIKAPYEGIITRRWVDTGAFVQSAESGKTEPLFTLARVDRLRIVADIPEEDAGLIRIGQPVQVHFSRGQPPLPGKVVRFADALDSETRTMRSEIELNDAEKYLRPGLFGSATITLADVPDALLLPTSAVLTDEGQPCVMCVEAGQAKRRDVKLGLHDGGRVQVIGGLSAGAQVITDGVNRVRDGQSITVVN